MQCSEICMLCYVNLKKRTWWYDMICYAMLCQLWYKVWHKSPHTQNSSKHFEVKCLPLISNVNIYFLIKSFKAELWSWCMLCYGMIWHMRIYEVVFYGMKFKFYGMRFQCYAMRFQCLAMLWCYVVKDMLKLSTYIIALIC